MRIRSNRPRSSSERGWTVRVPHSSRRRCRRCFHPARKPHPLLQLLEAPPRAGSRPGAAVVDVEHNGRESSTAAGTGSSVRSSRPWPGPSTSRTMYPPDAGRAARAHSSSLPSDDLGDTSVFMHAPAPRSRAWRTWRGTPAWRAEAILEAWRVPEWIVLCPPGAPPSLTDATPEVKIARCSFSQGRMCWGCCAAYAHGSLAAAPRTGAGRRLAHPDFRST